MHTHIFAHDLLALPRFPQEEICLKSSGELTRAYTHPMVSQHTEQPLRAVWLLQSCCRCWGNSYWERKSVRGLRKLGHSKVKCRSHCPGASPARPPSETLLQRCLAEIPQSFAWANCGSQVCSHLSSAMLRVGVFLHL